LTTYPLLRLSYRDRKMRAGLELAVAVAALVQAVRPAAPDDAG
jgi:hypothetical protein